MDLIQYQECVHARTHTCAHITVLSTRLAVTVTSLRFTRNFYAEVASFVLDL